MTGAPGEVRLLVDGVQLGPVGGPGAGLVLTERVGAEYGATVTFEIQARVTTSGTTIRCHPLTLYGLSRRAWPHHLSPSGMPFRRTRLGISAPSGV